MANSYDIALLPIELDDHNAKRFTAYLDSIKHRCQEGAKNPLYFPTITRKSPVRLADPYRGVQVSFRSIGYEGNMNRKIRKAKKFDEIRGDHWVQLKTEGEFEDVRLRKEWESGDIHRDKSG